MFGLNILRRMTASYFQPRGAETMLNGFLKYNVSIAIPEVHRETLSVKSQSRWKFRTNLQS